MVEAALRRRQWGLQQWGELYEDLPSRQSKVQVQDRSVISTIKAETCVASPAALQPLIDTSVAGQFVLEAAFHLQCATRKVYTP